MRSTAHPSYSWKFSSSSGFAGASVSLQHLCHDVLFLIFGLWDDLYMYTTNSKCLLILHEPKKLDHLLWTKMFQFYSAHEKGSCNDLFRSCYRNVKVFEGSYNMEKVFTCIMPEIVFIYHQESLTLMLTKSPHKLSILFVDIHSVPQYL